MSSNESEDEQQEWNPFNFTQWIVWLGACLVSVVSATVFIYATFVTQTTFAEYKNDHIRSEQEVSKRLERIEDKLDLLIRRDR